MRNKIRIGTRSSHLAVAQSRLVVERLKQQQPEISCELVKIKTGGDRIKDRPLDKIGGKGLFVKEIEQALLDEEIDFAVHSVKDLPRLAGGGLEIACFLERGDARDVLVSEKKLDDLPPAAVVGTGSARRRCQLGLLRDDLEVKALRGNVDSRLEKLAAGKFDALILAAAGLQRLGREEKIAQFFSVEQMIPSAGQGALGLQVREDDKIIKELISPLNDEQTELCVRQEKEFAFALDVGCGSPVGAFAGVKNNKLKLRVIFFKDESTAPFRFEETVRAKPGINPGKTLAEKILSRI